MAENISKIQLNGTVYTIGNETTTAVTSASTDNEIPTAKAVYDAIPVVPTKVSAFENDAGYLTEHQDLSDYATKDELADKQDKGDYALKTDIPVVPSKISAFENDKGYLTEHQDLSSYALKTEIPVVPTKVSSFENDKGYITEHQDLSGYALKTEIPTVPSKVSAFQNDAGYLTEHQDLSDYATKDELADKQDKGDYALKTDIPVVPSKVSAFENDKGYLTEHQDISNLATKTELNGKQDALVSGTNLKTINGQSLLGNGDITINGGGSSYTAGDGIDITNDVISVTGKVDTSTYNTYTAATDTALASKADTATTYTKTEVDTALSGYVTTDTLQDITVQKTFVGDPTNKEKSIKFKQYDNASKVGFVIVNSAETNNEVASFEFRPNTFTIDGVQHPLMYFGHYRNKNIGIAGVPQTVIGFRQYDQLNAAAYHYVLPLPEKAKAAFSLTTSFKDFYMPLGIKVDNSTMVKADNTGVMDISEYIGGGGASLPISTDNVNYTNSSSTKTLTQVLNNTEEITFTLEDGSTVTKKFILG